MFFFQDNEEEILNDVYKISCTALSPYWAPKPKSGWDACLGGQEESLRGKERRRIAAGVSIWSFHCQGRKYGFCRWGEGRRPAVQMGGWVGVGRWSLERDLERLLLRCFSPPHEVAAAPQMAQPGPLPTGTSLGKQPHRTGWRRQEALLGICLPSEDRTTRCLLPGPGVCRCASFQPGRKLGPCVVCEVPQKPQHVGPGGDPMRANQHHPQLTDGETVQRVRPQVQGPTPRKEQWLSFQL